MENSWADLCHAQDIAVEGAFAVVQLADGRKQRISVRDTGPTYELTSLIARSADLADISDASLLCWQRNRKTRLVGFYIDTRGRMNGSAWVPKVGLSATEFQGHLRRLAKDCDRLEYLVTGGDRQ